MKSSPSDMYGSKEFLSPCVDSRYRKTYYNRPRMYSAPLTEAAHEMSDILNRARHFRIANYKYF